jgi:hypothetical protein
MPSTGHGFAYHLSTNWQKGSVVYDGALYQDVSLLYDVVNDDLVVRHPNGFTMVRLFGPRVHSFTFYDRSFVAMRENNSAGIPAGYYEQSNSGKLVLLIKRVKSHHEKLQGKDMEHVYTSSDRYYLILNNRSLPVRNENSIYTFLQADESLRNLLRRNSIRFRKSPEEALELITAHYNSIHP